MLISAQQLVVTVFLLPGCLCLTPAVEELFLLHISKTTTRFHFVSLFLKLTMYLNLFSYGAWTSLENSQHCSAEAIPHGTPDTSHTRDLSEGHLDQTLSAVEASGRSRQVTVGLGAFRLLTQGLLQGWEHWSQKLFAHPSHSSLFTVVLPLFATLLIRPSNSMPRFLTLVLLRSW